MIDLRILFVLFGLTAALPTAAETPPLAKIAPIELSGEYTERRFFGHVVARQTVDLAFQVGGQIADFPAVEGETIAADGLIAQLDLEPFQLALDQARAQAVQAERTVARFQQLSGAGVSQSSLDDARTQAELANLAVLEAERALRLATLKAPFDALVAARNVPNFTTIAAGTPVARIHDMSELRIEIDVPEILFSRAGRNPDIEIFARFPASEQLFSVVPREFNAETSAVGQTFSITLGMEPPDDIVVLPGSSVTVIVKLKQSAVQPTIPGSALITANDGTPQVMVFEPGGAEEGTVSLRAIEIAPTDHGDIAIMSGLEKGEEIVVSGAALLNDGDTVRRFTRFGH